MDSTATFQTVLEPLAPGSLCGPNTQGWPFAHTVCEFPILDPRSSDYTYTSLLGTCVSCLTVNFVRPGLPVFSLSQEPFSFLHFLYSLVLPGTKMAVLTLVSGRSKTFLMTKAKFLGAALSGLA